MPAVVGPVLADDVAYGTETLMTSPTAELPSGRTPGMSMSNCIAEPVALALMPGSSLPGAAGGVFAVAGATQNAALGPATRMPAAMATAAFCRPLIRSLPLDK